jgi:hypothetical protein
LTNSSTESSRQHYLCSTTGGPCTGLQSRSRAWRAPLSARGGVTGSRALLGGRVASQMACGCPPPSCAAAPPTLSAGASIGINSDAAILPEFVAYPQLLHTLTHSTVAVWLITINGRLSHECTNGPFEYLRAHPAWQRFVKEPQIPFHPERCFHLGAVLVQLRQDHTIFICS